MEIHPNYPLSQLTTFRIGGLASFFVEVSNEDELAEALKFAQEKKKEIFVLGGGSNILISDKGFDGLVIYNKISGLKIEDNGMVTVNAGENWDDVVARAVEKDLAGIECLSGVPGSAGGAVVQNIGAYGQTLGENILEVYVVSASSGERKTFSREACKFSYRSSFFKKTPGQYVVVGFMLKLMPDGIPNTAYAHVKKHFENKPTPTLSDLRQFIIKIRASKGYLIMPGYERYNTAGSFFKNPIVSLEQFERLKPILGEADLNRYWTMPSGVKIAAAFLLERAGFQKGYRSGNVGISPKHSLSVVNFENASAKEIKSLVDQIRNVVLEKFGVALEEEVLYVGDFI